MNEWQESIANDFSRWLTTALSTQNKEKSIHVTDTEPAAWKKAFLTGLREIEEPMWNNS